MRLQLPARQLRHRRASTPSVPGQEVGWHSTGRDHKGPQKKTTAQPQKQTSLVAPVTTTRQTDGNVTHAPIACDPAGDALNAQLQAFFSAAPDAANHDDKIQQSLVAPVASDSSESASIKCAECGDHESATVPTVPTVITDAAHVADGHACTLTIISDHLKYYAFAYFLILVLIAGVILAPSAAAIAFPTVTVPHQADTCLSAPAALDGLSYTPDAEATQVALTATAGARSRFVTYLLNTFGALLCAVFSVCVLWPTWCWFTAINNPVSFTTMKV